jgi:tetratricopeptide (TPR) repeat protein
MIVPLFLLLLALQAPSPEAVGHLKAGGDALNHGNAAAAAAEFRKATEAAPDLPAGFVGLGQALMQTGDYQRAIAPLKRALQLNADLPGAEQLLGFALLSAGYAKEAIPYLEKVQALDALGVAQLKAGKLPEAATSLQAALAKRPGDVDLLYYYGKTSGLLSQQAFEKLRSTEPDSARAHQILGETYAILHNTDAAEKEYHEALRLRPQTRGLHLELGQLYAGVSQWSRAETEFRSETQLEPGDSESAYWLGRSLLEQGNAKEARLELARANELQPGAADILYALGKASSLSGDKATAEKSWLNVIEIDNDSPLASQAHFGLATLYRERGDAAKANAEMAEFQRLRSAKP